MLAAGMPVEVQVALITAASAVALSIVTGVLTLLNKRSASRVEDKIGDPNGQGNVVQMLERILSGQTGQDHRLAELEGGHNMMRRDVDRLAGKVDVLERHAIPPRQE